jgi:hypothetical protein
MKKMIDMNHRSEIGTIDWQFIYDMQVLAPDQVSHDLIRLTDDLLHKIPAKWKELKKKMSSHLDRQGTTFIAICDVENQGQDFTIEGTLKDTKGQPRPFHRLLIYDKDRFEDDYLGFVVTNDAGAFTLMFGKKVFSDFGLDSMPDIYFKVAEWDGQIFREIGKIKPKPHKVTHFTGGRIAIDFAVITI